MQNMTGDITHCRCQTKVDHLLSGGGVSGTHWLYWRNTWRNLLYYNVFILSFSYLVGKSISKVIKTGKRVMKWIK